MDYFFIYNSKLTNNKGKINAYFEDYPLTVILDSLFNDPVLAYKTIDKQIVIYPKLEEENEMPSEETAQNYRIIKGKIIDKKTKEPLAYSTISILGESMGTISNENGKFNFRLPEKYFNDSLMISFLGYNHLFFTANKDIIDTTFFLEPKVVSLQEIFIRWSDPKEIVSRAIQSFNDNYPDHPTQLRTFYRESLQRNKKYMLYIEGLLDIYKTRYRPTLFNDAAKLLQLRKFTNIESNDTILFKLQGGIDASLFLDIVKNPPGFIKEEELNNYLYEYEGMETADGMSVHVIYFETIKKEDEDNFSGTIYIDSKTYAIVKTDFEINTKRRSYFVRKFILRSKSRVRSYPKKIAYSITYKKSGDYFYINHVKGDLQLKARHKRKLLSSNYRISFEMITTDVKEANILRIKGKERISPQEILTELKHPYIENINEYWGKNNFILPEDNLLRALEKFKVEELTYPE